jgi:DNA-binding NtrC family response regulator
MPSEQNGRISVLLAMPPETPGFRGILSGLEAEDIDLGVVSDCRGVRRQLDATKPSVVVTAVTLCDGNWCDVLSYVVHSEVGASVVLYCLEIDERLRSEALARGAYDLLSGPVSAAQLRRCMEEAHLFSKPARV